MNHSLTALSKRVAAAAVLGLAATAQANVVDAASVGGLTTFQDTSTGLVWLDMNNFYDASATNGTTGNQMIATAQANGFTFATKADVAALFSTLPLNAGQWSGYAAVMGYGQPRQLIWGMYDDGTPGNMGYAWSWSTDSSWNFADDATDPNVVQNAGAPGNVDMGIWAYKSGTTAAVPEPSEMALMLAGLAAFAALRRRKA